MFFKFNNVEPRAEILVSIHKVLNQLYFSIPTNLKTTRFLGYRKGGKGWEVGGGYVLVARIKSVHMDQMTTCICILINNNSKHFYDSISDLNGFWFISS